MLVAHDLINVQTCVNEKLYEYLPVPTERQYTVVEVRRVVNGKSVYGYSLNMHCHCTWVMDLEHDEALRRQLQQSSSETSEAWKPAMYP